MLLRLASNSRWNALAISLGLVSLAGASHAQSSADAARSAPLSPSKNEPSRAHFDAPSAFTPPPEALNARFRPTSLPAGRWAISARFGAYVVDQLDARGSSTLRNEGVGFHGDFILPSISWGITDRLQISLTRPGFSYRFGNDDETEWLTALQVPFLLSSAGPEGGVNGFGLVARVDSRTWISSRRVGRPKTTALATSLSVQTRFVDERYASFSAFEIYLVQAQIGVVHFVDSWLTLAPNVGVGVAFDTREEGANTAVTFLSEVSRGVWSDPFLRLHFARWGSFDVYPSLGYEMSTTTLVAGAAGGFSFAW